MFLSKDKDDERFIESIINPILEDKYNYVKTIKYQPMPIKKRYNFFKSIDSMVYADYIYLTDINHSPCISGKKQSVIAQLKCINLKRIFIVKKEIESWYIAGINEKESKKLKIRYFENTDEILKEQFNKLIPKKYNSRIDFITELINVFSYKDALRKNSSFKYFWQNFINNKSL